MNTLYTTCLCFLVSLKQSFSLSECDEYKFDTKKGYCEIPDYDKFQIPPYPPLKVNISLGNMVNFPKFYFLKVVPVQEILIVLLIVVNEQPHEQRPFLLAAQTCFTCRRSLQ